MVVLEIRVLARVWDLQPKLYGWWKILKLPTIHNTPKLVGRMVQVLVHNEAQVIGYIDIEKNHVVSACVIWYRHVGRRYPGKGQARVLVLPYSWMGHSEFEKWQELERETLMYQIFHAATWGESFWTFDARAIRENCWCTYIKTPATISVF